MRGRGELTEFTPSGLTVGSAVNTFAAIHQREQCAKNSGLDLVGHGVAAGRDSHQDFPSIGNLINKFQLSFVAAIPQRGLAPHRPAFFLYHQGEMQDTFAHRGEIAGHLDLASFRVAGFGHEQWAGVRTDM